MKLITFGHEERKLAAVQPVSPQAPAKDTPLSKALTAAVILGAVVSVAKSSTTPVKGGIEVTRIGY
jgi:hypothetical protein